MANRDRTNIPTIAPTTQHVTINVLSPKRKRNMRALICQEIEVTKGDKATDGRQSKFCRMPKKFATGIEVPTVGNVIGSPAVTSSQAQEVPQSGWFLRKSDV